MAQAAYAFVLAWMVLHAAIYKRPVRSGAAGSCFLLTGRVGQYNVLKYLLLCLKLIRLYGFKKIAFLSFVSSLLVQSVINIGY